jgi:hypothetical protein
MADDAFVESGFPPSPKAPARLAEAVTPSVLTLAVTCG